jgi:DNA (cytosine-5)-methyltransferase 1
MKHLGDITKISGYTAPMVDCIIGGSPCQDLSVAGKREGLDGERSGLYIEQIRIVKEMRKRDRTMGRTGVDIRPRYMVWENVPGAFSSNKGEDFRIVLHELAKIADKDASVPMPPKGKWSTSGCIMGDGWSIAWRVLDAQFWGTSDKPLPQRRRRIALVADFGGESAPEILFVRQSESGNIKPGEPKRKEAPRNASAGVGADDCIGVDVYNTAITGDVVCPLTAGGTTSTGTCPKVMVAAGFKELNSAKARSDAYGYEVAPSLSANKHDASVVYSVDQGGIEEIERIVLDDQGGQQINVRLDGKAPTLRAETHGNLPCVISKSATFEPGIASREGGHIYDGVSGTLRANAGDNAMSVVYSVDQGGGKSSCNISEEQSPTLTCTHGGEPAVCYERNTRYIVRRLTPLECERLQGFPDGWTDIGEWTDSNGKKRQTSDAARYKALGNSIALPPWKWVLKRLCACYERDATMASLFDGIGGFPLIWEQLNGKGSCLWASEIEEFPMAVTKVRIGE